MSRRSQVAKRCRCRGSGGANVTLRLSLATCRDERVLLRLPISGGGVSRWSPTSQGVSVSHPQCWVSEVEFGRGLDCMQALTTAVERIRVVLEGRFGALSWEGVFPHHPGFQRAIPLSLDPAFSRRIERLVDREFERHLRQLKQRNTKRRTASKSGKRSST
jgi:hypothetical protein